MFSYQENIEQFKAIEQTKFVDGCILTERHEFLITKEDETEISKTVHKRSCVGGNCGSSCNKEIEEQTIAKPGEAPITTINTAMSEEELQLFEQCWSEKWTMDRQEVISKILSDLPAIEKMKSV